MDIRQLEAYVYTVKYRSFSLAAQKLYLSQPTVSAHICNLEKELHTQLLKRTTKTLSVTPAGQTLYNYAAEILDLRHKAILELSNEQKTMLHIGVSSVPSLYLLPELLAAYHEKTPEIRFRTSCSDSLDVINKVADSTCDIGLVGTKTAETNCEFLPVASDELVIATPNTPHFRAYQGQPDPLTALLREPFLLREVSRSFFADSSIHALRFLSLLLRLLSFDFSLCILLAQAGQYFDIPELGTYSTPHTVQFLGFNAVHRFVGVICNSPTKPMNL